MCLHIEWYKDGGQVNDAYIRDELAATDATWRFCSWHLNQMKMQVGQWNKNYTGWPVYESCREGGAIVVTGHEHSYQRTYLMDHFEVFHVISTSTIVRVIKGHSFVIVSGLGGLGATPQDDTLAANPWWASIYTKTQGAVNGALFCKFNAGGVTNRAKCYFKNINGDIIDQFDIQAGG